MLPKKVVGIAALVDLLRLDVFSIPVALAVLRERKGNWSAG